MIPSTSHRMSKRSKSFQQSTDSAFDDSNISLNIKQEEEDFELPSQCLEVQMAQEAAVCRVCKKIFRDKYHRKRHEKVHIKTGDLPPDSPEPDSKTPKGKTIFSCQICNKSFKGTYKLKRHENVHIKNGE